MNKKRKEIIASNEISRLETFHLGGYDQKVLLEGKKKSAPLLLILHGGPGSAIPFSVGCRGLFPALTEDAVVVYWDQLGCGINNYPLDNHFTIEHFVEMTVDLIRCLKKQFPGQPLNLFGTSWGSILTAKAAKIVPELIDHVLVYGQVVKDLAVNEEVIETLEKADLPNSVITKLARIKKEPTHSRDDMLLMTKWINKYSEGYQVKHGKKFPIGKLLIGLLTSPDYRLRDFIALIRNGYQKNTSLIEELLHLDLTQTLQQAAVPYYIFQGSSDIVTSTRAVRQLVRESNNPFLSVKVIKNNGHMPGSDGMDEIIKEAAQIICA